MQITSTTDTNYIGNPTFLNDLNGWSVANGNITRITTDGYTGVTSCQFTPTANTGLLEYDVVGMATAMPYVAQARVKASSGQQIFMQFADGSGQQVYTASGDWDLMTTGAVVQTNPAFGIQIGIFSELLVNVQDNATSAELITATALYFKLAAINVQENVVISEFYKVDAHDTTGPGGINKPFISDLNVLFPTDTINTSENYSIKVGAANPFISGNLFFITVSENATTLENTFASMDISIDRQFSVDNVMLSQNTVAPTYFDGDSGEGYHWYGVEGSSTSYYRQFETQQSSLSIIPTWDVLISWTKALSDSYTFFTVGTSTIGGPDFIAGASNGFPTYFNQYQYGDYAAYLLSASVTRNIGQYPYGAFGGQLNMLLDNSDFTFLPSFDPVIGNYIIGKRPIEYQVSFGGEAINLFSGSTTKPTNDIQNRTLAITAFDGMDYLNSYISQGQGPIALAANGNYINLPAQTIISDLLQEAGFSSQQFVLEQTLQSNIGYLCPSTYVSNDAAGAQGSIGSIIYDICEAEQGIFFFDESGVPTFWNREHIPTNSQISWSFDYSDIVNFSTEDTPIINDVTVQANPRVVQSLQNIWQLTSATIIPPASSFMVITNMAINGNFVTASGGFYNSPFVGSGTENAAVSEQVFIIMEGYQFLRYNVNDNTQITETVSVSIVNALNKPVVYDAVVTSEDLSLQIQQAIPFVSVPQPSVQENINTWESTFVLIAAGTQLNINDAVAVGETVTINVNQAIQKPSMQENVVTGEKYAVAIVTNAGSLYTTLNRKLISVSDTVITTETTFMRGYEPNRNIMPQEYVTTSETVNVVPVNPARTAPYLREDVKVYETVNVSTQTITGWSAINATLYQNLTGPIYNNSGQVTTLGGSGSYLVQQYTCTPSTQYVTQLQVKGVVSTTVTVAVVQNSVVLSSASVTMDGNWDTITVPAFNTNPVNTTFQVRVYTQSAATINVAAVMTQLGVGALTTYFDGATATTPNYDFNWNGTAYISTSSATPVGSATIVADFEDDNGSLPVTSVNSPLYNNANLDSSFLTNLNQDGTGITGNSFISLQGTVLNGSEYTMTFVNTYTQPIYITQATLFGTPAKVVYTINQEYKDPTSIALYGTNPTNNGQTLVINNDLIQDPSTALSDAYSLVNDYSRPYQRMVAEVFPAYMLQVGDNVNITINDTGQEQTYTVVGTTNGVGNDGGPLQELEVEVKNQVHYFTINSSVIGGIDSIAP